MHPTNTSESGRAPALSPVQHIRKETNTILSSPLFLALTICYTLAVAVGLYSLLHDGGQSILESFSAISADLTQALIDEKATAILAAILSAVGIAQSFLSLPAIATIVGLWIIYINAANTGDEKTHRIGFTIIQVVKFNMLLIIGFVALIGMFNLIKPEVSGPVAFLLGFDSPKPVKFAIIMSYLLMLFFNFCVLISFSFMKETACEASPIPQVSIFVAVVCILGGGLAVLFQLLGSFELTVLLYSASAILFGTYILYYRLKMNSMTTA